MTVRMLDSIYVSNLPDGADAYLGYAGGKWPTFAQLQARFPKARLLEMAISADEDAEGLDVENGDATDAQAPLWYRRQAARKVWCPVLYRQVSGIPSLLRELQAAGIPRSSVRLLSAHYLAGKHICGPATCKWPGVPACDGTQWRDTAPGLAGSLIDESVLLDDFFTAPRPAPKPTHFKEGPMLLNKGLGAITPIALPEGATKVRFYSHAPAVVRVNLRDGNPQTQLSLNETLAENVPVPVGLHAIDAHRADAGANDVSFVVF